MLAFHIVQYTWTCVHMSFTVLLHANHRLAILLKSDTIYDLESGPRFSIPI